jgi:pyrroloquinoline-quinone synthase
VVDDSHATTLGEIMDAIARDKPEEVRNMVAAGSDLVDARLEFFTSVEQAAKPLAVAS